MRRRKFSLSRAKSSTLYRTCLCSSLDAPSSASFPPADAAVGACIALLCIPRPMFIRALGGT